MSARVGAGSTEGGRLPGCGVECAGLSGRKGKSGSGLGQSGRGGAARGPHGEKKGAGRAGLGEGLGWVSSFLFLFLLLFFFFKLHPN